MTRTVSAYTILFTCSTTERGSITDTGSLIYSRCQGNVDISLAPSHSTCLSKANSAAWLLYSQTVSLSTDPDNNAEILARKSTVLASSYYNYRILVFFCVNSFPKIVHLLSLLPILFGCLFYYYYNRILCFRL